MHYTVVASVIVITIVLYMNKQQMDELRRTNESNIRDIKKLQLENKQLAARPTTIIKQVKRKSKTHQIRYEKKFRYIRIFSQDRDKFRFPNAAQFEYKLPSSISNIESVELSNFVMTRSQRVVDKHNDTMLISDITSGVKYKIKIPHGHYSKTSYISKINNIFSMNNIYIVFTFDNVAHSITMTNTGTGTEYEILYTTEERENSNFNLIGFECENFTLTPGESRTGTGRVDLFGATNLMVQAKEISYGYDDVTIANINVSSDIVTSYENDNDRPRRIISPLLKLNKVSLSVTFQPAHKERRLYEFNGVDYSLVLELVTIEPKMPFNQVIHS
jgi:regulator of replication initiation timing